MQMKDWYSTPRGECRHAYLSRVFDNIERTPCQDRCDVCRKEKVAVAVV
jgi:hypothetical protein